MKLLKKIFIVLFTLSIALSLVACSTKIDKPQNSVSNFFEAVKKSDINTVSKYLQGGSNNKDFKFQNDEEEKMTKLLFSNISYEILSTNIEGNSAKVKVKITSPDLKEAYTKVTEELIHSTLVNSPNEAALQKLILDKLTELINDPKAKKSTKEYNLNLVENSEKTAWLIKLDTELKDALTGNSLELNDLK